MLLDGGMKVFLFTGKLGMGLFRQGRGRAPADVLALWIIRVCRLWRQKCLWFQEVCWMLGKDSFPSAVIFS